MALTDSQRTSLKALLAEVEGLVARCKDRLLSLEEAKGKLTEMWDESRAILQPGSDEWRFLDREHKEAPGWWRAESSGYVASHDSRRFVHLQEALKQIIEPSESRSSDQQGGRARIAETKSRNYRGGRAGHRLRRAGKVAGGIVTVFPWIYKAVDAWSNVEFVWTRRSGIMTFLLSDLGLLAVTGVGLFLIWLSSRARN